MSLEWNRDGDIWIAEGHPPMRYKIRMLKNSDYSAVVLGHKKVNGAGNHLGYYGLLDETQLVCFMHHVAHEAYHGEGASHG